MVKHAHRVQVRLRLAGNSQLELCIDDGRGLPPGRAAALTRGLRNISRRATAAAGQITFEPGVP